MKDKIPIMGHCTVNSWNVKTSLVDTIFSSVGALRLIEFVLIICSLSPMLALPWESTIGIFNWIELPMVANIAFIAFNERNMLNQMTKWEWLHHVAVMSLGIISIEFVGILSHTATIFMQDSSTIAYWNHVGIMLFVASFGLSFFQSYTKRFIGVPVDERTKMLFIVFIIPAIIVLLWIVYSELLPRIFH